LDNDLFIHFVNLPVVDYHTAWKLQKDLAYARKDGRIQRDVVLWLEHFPVFTLGRRGGSENLKVSEKFLKKENILLASVERGGNITYHGPGQLVVYPIIDLHATRLSVPEYVNAMEEVMIRTAKTFGVRAKRNPSTPGVWIGNRKMGSIGIAIKRGISLHGFALNVNLSLTPFGWINPCGLENISVTSIEQERQERIPMKKVRDTAQRHMETVFGTKSLLTRLADIEDLLAKQ